MNVDGEASLSVAAPGQPSRAHHHSGEKGCAPRLRDLRFRLEYAALRGVIALMRLMPLRLSVRWSATLWRILAPRLNPKRQRLALDNLRIAFPDKGEEERLAICMAHWENLGRVVAEMVQIDRVLKHPSRIEIPDQHLLARDQGNAQGRFTYVTDATTNAWRTVDLAFDSTLELGLVRELLGPTGARVLAPFEVAGAPTV